MQRDQYLGALSNLGLGSDPLTQNRYSLAGGNPLSFIESDGHRPVADGRGTAGAAVSGGGGDTTPNFQTMDRNASSSGGGGSGGGGGSSHPTHQGATVGPMTPQLRRLMEEEERRQAQWEALEEDGAFMTGTINALHGGYAGMRARATGLSKAWHWGATQEIRSAAAAQIDGVGRLTRFAKSPWFKGAGVFGTVASGWFTYDEHKDAGRSTEESTVRAISETAGGLAGGAAVGAGCAAAGVVTAGVALAGCGLGAVLVGAVGSEVGQELGDVLYGESVKEAVSDVGSWLNPFD